MTENQKERIKQLRQYAQSLKDDPRTYEEGVNVLAYLILIEENQ